MYDKVFDLDTQTWCYPSFNVQYSARGYCGNTHFATLAQAQTFFESEVATAKGNSGKFEHLDTEPPNGCLRRVLVRHVNTKRVWYTITLIPLSVGVEAIA